MWLVGVRVSQSRQTDQSSTLSKLPVQSFFSFHLLVDENLECSRGCSSHRQRGSWAASCVGCSKAFPSGCVPLGCWPDGRTLWVTKLSRSVTTGCSRWRWSLQPPHRRAPLQGCPTPRRHRTRWSVLSLPSCRCDGILRGLWLQPRFVPFVAPTLLGRGKISMWYTHYLHVSHRARINLMKIVH